MQGELPAPAAASMAPTRYWHRLEDGRVRCDLCPRACALREGQRGFCFVRACEEGAIVLTTYGRTSGIHVDPVEKKPLFHFLPGTAALSFGTVGCNLACRFCQNWDISRAREMDVLAVPASPEGLAAMARRLRCASVAFTYNDPVVFHEYAIDAARACRALGIRTVAVTAGYVSPEPRAEFYRHMDAANVDLKAFSEGFYRKLAGGHLQPVLDTLVYLKRETSVWLELTHLLIPGENGTEGELRRMTEWVVDALGPDVPMHFTAFHPSWRMLDTPPTTLDAVRKARRIALRSGVRYAYTGNVWNPEGEATYCHGCGRVLVARDGYAVRERRMSAKGCCLACGLPCAGVFS